MFMKKVKQHGYKGSWISLSIWLIDWWLIKGNDIADSTGWRTEDCLAAFQFISSIYIIYRWNNSRDASTGLMERKASVTAKSITT